jgi:hypothetical protein
MTARWIPALACAAAVGCAVPGPLADEWKLPNYFGTPFRTAAEVLGEVPPGSSVETLQAVMRAHGYVVWSSQRQDEVGLLIFRPADVVALRASEAPPWVAARVRRGILVELETKPPA